MRVEVLCFSASAVSSNIVAVLKIIMKLSGILGLHRTEALPTCVGKINRIIAIKYVYNFTSQFHNLQFRSYSPKI